MSENRYTGSSPGGGREMVCIETNRIYDSCKDRDCYENVRVYLTDFGNSVIERTSSVRVKGASIAWVYIGIDPVAFNRGFYTVTIRFFVKICFEACLGKGRAQEFEGIAVVEKRVILYGSESCVSVFRSNPDSAYDYCTPLMPAGHPQNVPIAVVETVDPIVLQAKVVEESACDTLCCCCCCCGCSDIPEALSCRLDGTLTDSSAGGNILLVSFGIFSIVRLIRPAEYLISACEYVIPDKECIAAEEDDPCALFRSMAFPIGEFSPKSFKNPPLTTDHGGKCGCC